MDSAAEVPRHEFDLSGGVLCLDFANTVSGRAAPADAVDHLQSFADVVSFAQQSKLISRSEADGLQEEADARPDAAERVLRQAIALRESIFRVFAGLAGDRPVRPGDIRRLQQAALDALGHRRLAPADGNYHWVWGAEEKKQLERIWWPIAESATDLLTSADLRRVRQCELATCAWLFLDRSRNRSRRWCDMKVCGNREKARRHYKRAHSS